MRFLIEARLPPSVAHILRECGQEAAHVFDLLRADAWNSVIGRIPLDSGDGLVAKDEDCAEWSRLRQPARAVLRLRSGNLKRVERRAKVVPLLPELVQRLQSGETPIEVFGRRPAVAWRSSIAPPWLRQIVKDIGLTVE